MNFPNFFGCLLWILIFIAIIGSIKGFIYPQKNTTQTTLPIVPPIIYTEYGDIDCAYPKSAGDLSTCNDLYSEPDFQARTWRPAN